MSGRICEFGLLASVAVIGGCAPGPDADSKPSAVPWMSSPATRVDVVVGPSKEVTFSIRGMT